MVSEGYTRYPPPRLARTFERFLGLPVPAVLGTMWLAGAAPMSVPVLALYLAWSSP